MKRGFDVAAAAVLLLVMSPVFVAIGLAVALTSGWPVLYRWRVVGEGGRPFTGYKFRTMVRDADALKPRLLAANEMRGPVFKMRNDPRVTRIGALLRSTSLDELPQLWSVLKGDMSLVGPRPPLVHEYAQYEPWQKRRLSVTPGITCLWQIRGRNAISDFDEWARLDLQYIDNWSLWVDVQILLRTVPAVLRRCGAW